MSNSTELFLYARSRCSPCNEFKAHLDINDLSYQLINIDSDPELIHRYGTRVPVLVADNTEVCSGIFDLPRVLDYLQKT